MIPHHIGSFSKKEWENQVNSSAPGPHLNLPSSQNEPSPCECTCPALVPVWAALASLRLFLQIQNTLLGRGACHQQAAAEPVTRTAWMPTGKSRWRAGVQGSALCHLVAYPCDSLFSKRRKHIWLLLILLEVPAVCKGNKKRRFRGGLLTGKSRLAGPAPLVACLVQMGLILVLFLWKSQELCRKVDLMLEMQRCRRLRSVNRTWFYPWQSVIFHLIHYKMYCTHQNIEYIGDISPLNIQEK